MKIPFIVISLLLAMVITFAQPGVKPAAKEKIPAQKEINKMMEAGMKDMREAEKVEMRKMMKGLMPALQERNRSIADYPEFTSNLQLVPKKDVGRLAEIPQKELLQSEIAEMPPHFIIS